MSSKTWTKSILIEWRKPANARERRAFGATYADDRIARVFIDTRAPMDEQIDTFFHEMAHVFFAFTKHEVPDTVQEAKARRIGKTCTEVLKS